LHAVDLGLERLRETGLLHRFHDRQQTLRAGADGRGLLGSQIFERDLGARQAAAGTQHREVRLRDDEQRLVLDAAHARLTGNGGLTRDQRGEHRVGQAQRN
jgi:hypothetical protein